MKAGDMALYYDGVIEESVMIDEVLDDDEYAVRFLDSCDIFTVKGPQLTA